MEYPQTVTLAHPVTDGSFLTRLAWLSIAAAILIWLKTVAYLVALLSDALESFVNLVGRSWR